MEYDLTPQIVNRLQHEFRMTEQGDYLRGYCPDCGKKSLWTWLNNPGNVQCDRINKCAYSEPTFELFPDLFEKLNEKHPPTEQDPSATAKAYLSLIRGFELSQLSGLFEQGKYWHPHGNKGTATVRFYLDEAKTMMWERLIDDVTITNEDGSKETRNKNFKGTFKGYWWQPPTLTIEVWDEVWLVEGIFDAIALNQNGIKAVAIMSSGTWPSESIKPHLHKDITWVIATDNDSAGRKALEKHSQTLRDLGENVAAALSSDNDKKADWNDLHKAGKLTEQNLNRYRYLGNLALAQSANEKAQIIWERNPERGHFIFSFRNRTYAATVNKEEHGKVSMAYWANREGLDPMALSQKDVDELREKSTDAIRLECDKYAFSQSVKMREIATFSMDYLYFQQPDNGEDGQYFFRFMLANHGQERQIAFTHKTISAASDFKKSAMRIPGALFTGTAADLDSLYREWTRYNIKEVRTLDFVGYDKPSKTYVFNNFAVENKKILKLNNQSFFELKKQGIKTTVDIKQTLSQKDNHDWVPDFKTAFGTKGLVALSWWFGCLFVEQVRDEYSSYPFFELVGEAASGKSSLVDFMWKLYGKDGESFNPNSSTLAGRTRKMAEVSNLPVVFNETDNENDDKNNHVKRFNWDEQKDLFEGEFGRVTGIKSQDNSTKKPAFKAGLMIVQNIPVMASEAILTRITHLNFDTSHHSPQGYEAAGRLNRMPISEVNGFILNAVQHAEPIMKAFKECFARHQKRLTSNPDIKLNRIVDNHAKIMAFTELLAAIYPAITEHDVNNVHAMLETMATQRQQSLNEDSQVVQQFWAQFDYLDTKPGSGGYAVNIENQMNHSKHPEQQIAVNLEHFHSQCKVHNLPFMEPKELRRQLTTSKKREYIENKPVKSRIEDRAVRCWIFKR